jgi:Leucine-rich repeat (LRR) protein
MDSLLAQESTFVEGDIKDVIRKSTDRVANPQDATEPKGTPGDETPKEETKAQSDAPAATTKKKKKKKKKKKPSNRRDAAGRIVRRRLKGKGRDRVVRAEFFRKGKDAKIGLETINEHFYDGLAATNRTESDDNDKGNITDEDGWDDIPMPPDSCSDEDYDSDSDEEDDDDEEKAVDLEAPRDMEPATRKTVKVSKTGAVRRGKRNSGARGASNSTEEASSVNQSSLAHQQTGSTPDPQSARGDRTSQLQNEPEMVVDTVPSSDDDSQSDEEESSTESTCCTSTASFRDPEQPILCFRNYRNMIFTAVVFVILVAATTVLVGYFVVFRKRGGGEEINDIPIASPSTVAPTLAPTTSAGPSPPSVSPTQAPTSIFGTLSTSCYLPENKPDRTTLEAEYAPEQLGVASAGNSSAGYCGEGYVTVPMTPGSGFGFPSLRVNTTGYYRVALRYNNAGKANAPLDLRINGQEEGTFDLVPTGNETSWLVDGVDGVLLQRGEHSIGVSVVNTEEAEGCNVDWLTLALQEPLSQFDYLSGLLAKTMGITTQSLSQKSTLHWMATDDPIDYSTMTDDEIIERYALVQIYDSAAGDVWKNKNQWLSEFHACGWYGITCSKDMLVTDLMLGTFLGDLFLRTRTEYFPVLCSLTNAFFFCFISASPFSWNSDNNGLVGYLPTDLSLLTNLILISLDNNDLQGSIPVEIGKLTNLSKLFLKANFFNGALPSELASLQALEAIDLRANFLSGAIPEEIYSMLRLESLALGSNFLTGTLSTNVGQLKELKDLDLRSSLLSGTIPTELGELTLLTRLSLGYNLFSGQIPGELGLLQNLSLLDISKSYRVERNLP